MPRELNDLFQKLQANQEWLEVFNNDTGCLMIVKDIYLTQAAGQEYIVVEVEGEGEEKC